LFITSLVLGNFEDLDQVEIGLLETVLHDVLGSAGSHQPVQRGQTLCHSLLLREERAAVVGLAVSQLHALDDGIQKLAQHGIGGTLAPGSSLHSHTNVLERRLHDVAKVCDGGDATNGRDERLHVSGKVGTVRLH